MLYMESELMHPLALNWMVLWVECECVDAGIGFEISDASSWSKLRDMNRVDARMEGEGTS